MRVLANPRGTIYRRTAHLSCSFIGLTKQNIKKGTEFVNFRQSACLHTL